MNHYERIAQLIYESFSIDEGSLGQKRYDRKFKAGVKSPHGLTNAQRRTMRLGVNPRGLSGRAVGTISGQSMVHGIRGGQDAPRTTPKPRLTSTPKGEREKIQGK